ncbi:glycosyltransferase family 4 protein [Halorientalis regularis]|nr:glycosyltransferase family 4 protein [Halorientalis regularis]
MSDETTVLHLITRYLDGGAETTTENEIEALLDADADYDVILGTGIAHEPDALTALETRGVRTVIFRTIRHYDPVAAVIAIFAVAIFLVRNDVDVIHTHSTEAGVVGRLAGWLARTPVVVHEIHGDPITADRNALLNRFLLWAERMTAPMATRLVVKSDRIRDAYLERGVGRPEQYVTIYHGVDVERFAGAAPSDPVANATDPVVTFVGRVVDGKGLFDLLDAVERIDASMALFVVGDGPLTDAIEREVDERGLEHVRLLGYRDDVAKLLAGSDLLVLPSYREGTPRAVTEAQAAGVPVVATDVAGIPEQVADGASGILVPPGDVDALADAMELLLDDEPTRERMAGEAVEQVRPFRRDHVADQIRSLYATLVDPRADGVE